jgi:dolichyl-phosphate beta-glucosyltransferase
VDLSIVVPAHNEEARLPSTLETLGEYSAGRDCEIVVATDVQSGDNTVAIAESFASRTSSIRVVEVPSRGKGHALMTGIRAAAGDITLTADADLAVEPAQFERLVEVARSGAIAIGSRYIPGAKRIDEPGSRLPLSRLVLGRAFNLVVRAFILPGIRDTQCGFKAFRRETVQELFGDLQAQGWIFDVELLARARARGYPIKEVPVTWRHHHGSSVRPWRQGRSIGAELWSVYRRVGRSAPPR